MSSDIRLRRHVDGRVALNVTAGCWLSTRGGPGSCVLADGEVSGDGWSELFVAELPEPDYELEGVEVWDLHTGKLTVDRRPNGELETPHLHTVDRLRSDALRMLAAADACERYRAEREETE